MKHAGPDALDALGGLLLALRSRGLKERSPGVFTRRGRAWLHFHEDSAGLFADLRVASEWERLPVSTADQQERLLALVDRGP